MTRLTRRSPVLRAPFGEQICVNNCPGLRLTLFDEKNSADMNKELCLFVLESRIEICSSQEERSKNRTPVLSAFSLHISVLL